MRRRRRAVPEAGADALNAAQVVARRLAEAGCRFAFGIPGGEVLALLDALGAAGIDFRLAKHENAAGFMAQGAHCADGAPGILVATLGPGLANGVTAIASAHQDRLPLIVLTGCVDPAHAHTYTHQVFDHSALMAPITKASLLAADGVADAVIDKALAIAMDGRPGPVHVDLPVRVAVAAQPSGAPRRRARPAASAPVGPELETARAWLAEAERPLMIAGLDVLNQGAGAVVAAFAEDFSVPLITTYNAKGVLDEDHRLSLGGAGLSPKADGHLMPLIGQADLIVLAGYDPIEMRDGWRHPWDGAARVVDFAAEPNTHYMHQARLHFVGHVGAGIGALRAGLGDRPTWPGGEPAAVRAALAEAFPGHEAWGPAAVIDVARRVLPRHAVATVDTGAHRILLNQMWTCHGPRTLLQSTGLGTMGGGLPLAMGYKLAAPERPVVAFTGDAGLEMVLGELAVLRDMGLGLVIVVFVDRSLALIDLKQRALGLEAQGVDFGGTDFAAVAGALGGTGVSVHDRAGLEAALETGLAADGFTVIACDLGARPYAGRI